MKAVVVIGTGRSGTSCVAGVLQCLGVSMGDKLFGADNNNARGYFEDVELVNMIRSSHAPRAASIKRYVKSRKSKNLWGMKHPETIFLMDEFEKWLPSFGIIWAKRHPVHCINSFIKAWNNEDAEQKVKIRYKLVQEYYQQFNGPKLCIDYDTMVENRLETVKSICCFINKPLLREAVEFIDAGLRHHKTNILKKSVKINRS